MSSATIRRAKLLLNILITSFFVYSCSNTTHYAPVKDSRQPPSGKITHHIVLKGETLYSIAWRYDLDYRKLALVNNIAAGFKIYPGQRLSLKESVTPTGDSLVRASKVVKHSPKLSMPEATRSKKETPKERNRPILKNLAKPNAWVWPARGKLIAGYQSNNGLNKGIDIQGNIEEPVVAAAAGKIVYSGDGLRGYGKLVIVKHSEKYLSAYAHNHRVLVKEGVMVKQGQKIAEMGATGTDSIKLHFEIRYDGKPVNPLRFLPKI